LVKDELGQLMAKIDVQALIPILGRHVLKRMPIVVAGIVDEDVNPPEGLGKVRDHRLKIGQIGEVAVTIERDIRRVGTQARDQGLAGIVRNVDESDATSLCDEGFHETFADTGTAPRDENPLARKARIDRPDRGGTWRR
jgi:hypothetical protein